MQQHYYRTLIILLSALLASLLFASPLLASEISRGAMLSNSCAGCHGTDGNSPGAIPSIAGKSKEFLQMALTEFRSGVRTSTVMSRHAKGYSDEEIKLIAEFFAGKK